MGEPVRSGAGTDRSWADGRRNAADAGRDWADGGADVRSEAKLIQSSVRRRGGAMLETEQFSLLIGDIYDAALNPAQWPLVLKKAAVFVHGISAFIFAKDVIAGNGELVYGDGGIEDRYVQSYYDKYVKLDPSTTALFFSEIGQLNATADLVPYDEFLESRFYKEWAKPQRLVDVLSVTLDKSTRGVAMFGVFRHEQHGLVDDAMRQRMQLIAPHVRRAVLIGRTVDLKTAEADTLADTLDGLAAGIFLVNAEGHIIRANAVGHDILQSGDYLHALGGQLATRDPETDKVLHDAFAGADGGDAALGIKAIAVPLTGRSDRRYVAHVLPLTSGTRRRVGRSYAAAALLVVHEASLNNPSPPEVIAKAYRLTPSELRVLIAVVEIGGIPEVAKALGVSSTTVKSHLGQVYEKTGIHRQADLVKLFAGFSNPLVG
jgi:DNA-binding CsgD family transcriptional regulator